MYAIRTLTIIAALAFSAQASAGSGVIKCIDQDGRVTLTDTPCGAGAQSEVLIAGPQTEPGAAEAPPPPWTALSCRHRMHAAVLCRRAVCLPPGWHATLLRSKQHV